MYVQFGNHPLVWHAAMEATIIFDRLVSDSIPLTPGRSPHCCYAAWSSLAVWQLSTATAAWPFHRVASLSSQLSAVCRFEQSGEFIDKLAWRCLSLGLPSAKRKTIHWMENPWNSKLGPSPYSTNVFAFASTNLEIWPIQWWHYQQEIWDEVHRVL